MTDRTAQIATDGHVQPIPLDYEKPATEVAAKKLKLHMPQLDGIRGISAILIIAYHYTWYNVVKTDYGIILLGLFFVLSGFLISGILLDSRGLIDRGSISFWQSIKIFFIRRFLRIFPLYYGILAILYLIDLRGFQERIWWHLSYLSNYFFCYVVPAQGVKMPPERHFWSLAVEEQFYMLWPFVILLLPRRALIVLLGIFIVGAPVYRVLMYFPKSHAHEWMMPACLDLLAAGAVLAILYRTMAPEKIAKLLKIVGIIGVAGMALNITLDVFDIGRMVRSFSNFTVISIFGFWLIGTAATGFKGIFGTILSNPVITYFGRISYGLYVIHMFTPYLAREFAWRWFEYRLEGWAQLLICFPLTFLFAVLSWHLYESPLNNLKRFFSYRKKPPIAATPTAA